jgi:lipopolysaccharide transport protein LptA
VRRIVLLLSCLIFALASGSAPRSAHAAGAGDISILVAPFEVVAPPGAPLPDVALLLADRLGTKGLGRVVGPSALSIAPVAEPSDADVKAWGGDAKADLVVVGRSTRLGRRISLDLRVRSSADGSVVGTHVAEAPRPEDLGRAVEELATEIIESAEAAPIAGSVAQVAAVSAAPAGMGSRSAREGSQGEASGADAGDDAARPRGRAPLSIQSEEMEALQADDGTRRFLFRRNVRLAQGDMHVYSRRMEAFYPAAGDGGPSRMVATGQVRLRQEGRRAKCERATFYTQESRVVCEGRDAELVQGTDRVRGREIEFFLDTDRMIVRGGADVFLEPSAAAPEEAAVSEDGSAGDGE